MAPRDSSEDRKAVARVAGLLASGAAPGKVEKGFRDLSRHLSQLDDEQRFETLRLLQDALLIEPIVLISRSAAAKQAKSEAHRSLLASALELLTALSAMGASAQIRDYGGFTLLLDALRSPDPAVLSVGVSGVQHMVPTARCPAL
jgi:hypothetical protein